MSATFEPASTPRSPVAKSLAPSIASKSGFHAERYMMYAASGYSLPNLPKQG